MSIEIQDNNIEWYTGDKTVTLSFTQKKYVNKILKYAKTYSEIDVLAKNSDGSICAHIPLSWVKIFPPRKGRELTQEEKEVAKEKLRLAREKKSQNK